MYWDTTSILFPLQKHYRYLLLEERLLASQKMDLQGYLNKTILLFALQQNIKYISWVRLDGWKNWRGSLEIKQYKLPNILLDVGIAILGKINTVNIACN